MAIRTSYDPEYPPAGSDWLALPEQERIRVVATHHMANRLKSGNAKAHAALHVMVENQVARGLGPTVRAVSRLQAQGLSRHDALHAIGAVVSSHVFAAMREPKAAQSQELQSSINAALERLTAESWRAGYGA